MKKLLAVFTAVFMVCIMTVPAFARETYSAFTVEEMTQDMVDSYNAGRKYMLLIHDGYVERVIMTTAPLIYAPNNMQGVLRATDNGSYASYALTTPPDEYWTQHGGGATENNSVLYNNVYKVSWANYDVKNSIGQVLLDGDETFPPAPPLAELVQKVTEEELETVTVPEIHRVMMVVVTVAVGCLASLMALVLLKKRWFVS